MIDYDKVREVFAKGLKDYVKLPVIRLNHTKEPPAYDYLGYTITTIASDNKGTYGVYSDGIERKPVTQIWSISSFSDDDTKAVLLALKARDWIANVGIVYLSDNDIVVQSVGSVTNRDNILTTGYEYRKGFDVVLSLMDSVKDVSETNGEIDTFEIGIKEQEKGGE